MPKIIFQPLMIANPPRRLTDAKRQMLIYD